MKKNTKKTATVVGMFGLLGLVLGMGGSTFAKYYASADAAAATATVAKFGLVVNANATNLWGTQYKAGDTTATVNGTGAVVVEGASSVVAPGTSGSATFTVSGVSEVKAQLSLSIDVVSEIHLDTYYPMKWTCGEQVGVKLADITDVTVDIPASSSTFTKEITLSWDWAFTGHDTEDTILGQYANGTDLPAEYTAAEKTVKFTISASLTQVNA